MSVEAARLRAIVLERALRGPGESGADQREAAFHNQGVPEAARALIDKVAKNAYRVGDEDVAAAKAAGLSEDQVFELVVSAALGQSTRQLEAALAALDAATGAAP